MGMANLELTVEKELKQVNPMRANSVPLAKSPR